jgi:hypothetical protein
MDLDCCFVSFQTQEAMDAELESSLDSDGQSAWMELATDSELEFV